eukprot:10837851-Karenia_brevis.AAC.1
MGEGRGPGTAPSDRHWYGAGLAAAHSSMKGIQVGMQAPIFGGGRKPMYQGHTHQKVDASVLELVGVLEKAVSSSGGFFGQVHRSAQTYGVPSVLGVSPSHIFPWPHVSRRGARSACSAGVISLVNLMVSCINVMHAGRKPDYSYVKKPSAAQRR